MGEEMSGSPRRSGSSASGPGVSTVRKARGLRKGWFVLRPGSAGRKPGGSQKACPTKAFSVFGCPNVRLKGKST
jgi:hypothetical protein